MEPMALDLKLRVPPPLWLLVFGLLMWGLHRMLPLGHWIGTPWRPVGWLIVIAGVITSTTAALQFRRVGTTLNPLAPAKATTLVTSGAFSCSRNPMYLGLLVVLTGWAFVLGSASPWVVPPLYVVVITRVQIAPEEQVLARLFGDAYRDYRRRVGRWLGRGAG
jgi:protein-S-isoprenylcysteine O-methyltransferase Ste14